MVQRTKAYQESAFAGFKGGSTGSCPSAQQFSLSEAVPKKSGTVTSERRKKPNRVFQPNPFIVRKYSNTATSDGVTYCYSPLARAVTWSQNWPYTRPEFHPQPLLGLYDLIVQNAVVDAFAEVNSPSVFDLAPMVFEATETLAYVGKLFKALWSVVKSLFSKGFDDWAKGTKTVVKAFKDPENLWLEYRYAVMPLILSINDAIEAFKGGEEIRTVSKRLTRTFKDTIDPNYSYGGWSKDEHDFGIRGYYIDSVSGTCKLYVRSKVDPAPLGTGVNDVIRGIWEVVPLSFVFNWFLGVEEWLGSMRNANVTLDASYSTLVVDRKVIVRNDKPGSLIQWQSSFVSEIHNYEMERKVGVVPPNHPILQAELLSLNRSADAIALIIGFLKSLLGKRR